jgi:NADPH:quinone reductase-like Zn-dependent oxidoreductase
VELPSAIRERAWRRLADDLKPRHLDRIASRTIPFDELPAAFDEYIRGGIVGRTVVDIGAG